MTPSRILWYFADPMCSWCWGFSPVIDAIKETYADQVKVALMLGGLRPGTTEPMTTALRDEILHHWHEVQRRTGQAFVFENAMPAGFVYDTEPPSRAVIAVAEINPEATFPYFKSVQAAFYTQSQDVTQAQTLTTLAETASHRCAAFPRAVSFRRREGKNPSAFPAVSVGGCTRISHRAAARRLRHPRY